MKTYNEFINESKSLTEAIEAPKGQGDSFQIRAFEGGFTDFVKLLKRGYKFYTGGGTKEIRDWDQHRAIMWVSSGENANPVADLKKFKVVTKGAAIKG